MGLFTVEPCARVCFRVSKILTITTALGSALFPAFLAVGFNSIYVQSAHAEQACDGFNEAGTTPPRGPGGAGASFQQIILAAINLQEGDQILFSFNSINQNGGNIIISQITIGGQALLGSSINLNDVASVPIVNNGSGVISGDIIIEIQNDVEGAVVQVSASCDPDDDNNAGGGDNDNAGAGLDPNIVRDQVRGTISVTNPETVNGGDLTAVFGVKFNEDIFVRARQLQEELENTPSAPVIPQGGTVPTNLTSQLQPSDSRNLNGQEETDGTSENEDSDDDNRRLDPNRIEELQALINRLREQAALFERVLEELGLDENSTEEDFFAALNQVSDELGQNKEDQILENINLRDRVDNIISSLDKEERIEFVRDFDAGDNPTEEERAIQERVGEVARLDDEIRLNGVILEQAEERRDAQAEFFDNANLLPDFFINQLEEILGEDFSGQAATPELRDQLLREIAQAATNEQPLVGETPADTRERIDQNVNRLQQVAQEVDRRLERRNEALRDVNDDINRLEDFDKARKKELDNILDDTADAIVEATDFEAVRIRQKQQELAEQGEKLQEQLLVLESGGLTTLESTKKQLNDAIIECGVRCLTSNYLDLEAHRTFNPVNLITSKSTITRTKFNKRFNLSNGTAVKQPITVLGYVPRQITSRNGITAISDRTVNARFDLRQWRLEQKKSYGQTVSLGERINPNIEDGRPLIDLPGFLGDERFNLFGASNISFGSNGNADQDSVSYAVSGGFSWLVLPRLNVGLAGRYQNADIDSLVSDIEADTWGIAAFAQSKLNFGRQAFNLEGIVSYSRSNLDNIFNNLGVVTTADSVTKAFSSQIKASTRFDIEKVSITPFLSLSYINTDQESFILSDGQVAPGETNDQVTFSSGTSFSTSFFIPDAEIKLSPSLGLGAFGTVSDGGDVGLSANGSLGFQSKRGIDGGIGLGFSSVTGGTRNVSLSGNISIPLN